MSQPSQQEIAEFLEQLGAALAQSVNIPDLEDLYDVEGEGIVRASPEDIEMYLVMGLQQAEIARQEQAEDQRIAAQGDIVASVAERVETVPEPPAPAALDILADSGAGTLPGLIDAAIAAYTKLADAQGGPDDAFEAATSTAYTALDRRDAAIAGLHQAISREIAEREQTIRSVGEAFTEIKGTILFEASEMMKAEKPASAKKLKARLGEVESAVAALPELVTTAAPDAFAAAVSDVRKAFDGLVQPIKAVNEIAQSRRGEARKGVLAENRWVLQRIPAGDLAILPADTVSAPLAEAIETHRKSFATLEQLAPNGTGEAFELARQQTERDKTAAERAHATALRAVETERQRRRLAVKELTSERGTITDPKLIEGTSEAKDFAAAKLIVANAFKTLNEAIMAALPAAFTEALRVAGEAVTALGLAATDAAEKAKLRLAERNRLRKEVQLAGEPVDTALKSLPTTVAPDAAKAIRAAFIKDGKAAINRIDGRDPEADNVALETAKKQFAVATRLVNAFARLDAASFTPVAGNVVITGGVSALIKQLETGGIGEGAIGLVETLDKDVGKITDRYRDIGGLRSRYDEVCKSPNVLRSEQRKLDAFPTFESTRDEYDKGQLTVESDKFRKIIISIEEAIEKAQETQEYLLSKVHAYIQLVDSNSGDPVAAMETLVRDGDARRGDISDAYRSSHDRPDRYSVEVEVPIENRRGVVVHAHCDADGTPKAGNGCHIKLWKYRFDPLSFQLSGTLRGPLLPPKAENLLAAQRKYLA